MRSQDKVSTLPLWAQRKIEVLESEVKALTSRLDAFSGESKTHVCIESRIHDPDSTIKNIPDHTSIRFLVGDNYMDVRWDKDSVYVISYGPDEFLIKPRAANSISLAYRPREE